MAFDPAEQRRIMGSFATGVTVVTTSGELPTGLTANAAVYAAPPCCEKYGPC